MTIQRDKSELWRERTVAVRDRSSWLSLNFAQKAFYRSSSHSQTNFRSSNHTEKKSTVLTWILRHHTVKHEIPPLKWKVEPTFVYEICLLVYFYFYYLNLINFSFHHLSVTKVINSSKSQVEFWSVISCGKEARNPTVFSGSYWMNQHQHRWS